MATKAAAAKKAPAKATAKKATAPAKKAPVKKAAPAKKAAKAPVDHSALQAEIVKRRESGESMSDIATSLKLNPVTVNDHYLRATVSPVKEAPTPTRIKTGRDKDGHSWMVLAIMYGTTKAKIQELYREAGGDPKAVKAPTAKATGAAKKAAAPKSVGKPIFGELGEAEGKLSEEEKALVIEKVDGKKITRLSNLVPGSNETEEIRVKSGLKVGHQKNGVRVIAFHDGDKSRTVALSSIVKVGR